MCLCQSATLYTWYRLDGYTSSVQRCRHLYHVQTSSLQSLYHVYRHTLRISSVHIIQTWWVYFTSNSHEFELHRPSNKGTKLLLKVIKAIIIIMCQRCRHQVCIMYRHQVCIMYHTWLGCKRCTHDTDLMGTPHDTDLMCVSIMCVCIMCVSIMCVYIMCVGIMCVCIMCQTHPSHQQWTHNTDLMGILHVCSVTDICIMYRHQVYRVCMIWYRCLQRWTHTDTESVSCTDIKSLSCEFVFVKSLSWEFVFVCIYECIHFVPIFMYSQFPRVETTECRILLP